jgi:DNA-directed RNA polymerase subunit E'/Rpb7
MESEAIFDQRIVLTAKDINTIEKTPINTIIANKLRDSLENKCSKHGFVVPGSLDILSRSLGRVENGRFTGAFVYQVQARGKVLVPVDGAIIKGTILKKNKMGIYVYYRNAFRIMVPRDFHLGSNVYETLKIGDEIEVQLKKSRFQVNDPYIISVGVLLNNGDTIMNEDNGMKEELSQPTNIRKTVRKPALLTPIKEESNANVLADLTKMANIVEPSDELIDIGADEEIEP